MEQENSLFGLRVDAENSSYLLETAKWAKFLGIVGMVVCALMLFFGLIVAAVGSSTLASAYGSAAMGAGMVVTQVTMMIVFSLLYFLPSLYIFRFAKRMQIGLRANNQEQYNRALSNLKSAFKFVGILTVVVLGFYVLIIVFAIVGAGVAAGLGS